jgi:HlyD family secretion protein
VRRCGARAMSEHRFRSLVAVLIASLALASCARQSDGSLQGWVEAELVFVAPDEAGRVVALNVALGDAVQAGAPLFAVDDELQRSDVAANAAAVAEARARLDRAVAQQQRPAEIAVLEAQQKRAEAALALSTAELERQRQLIEKGISSKAQFDTAQANFHRDTAALDEVRRQIKVAQLAARDEDIAAARQALAAAEARLSAAETRLARRKVSSPVSGVVRQVYFRPGEMVASGRPVLALLPPANLKVRFFIPETRIQEVTVGQTVRVRCDGCASDIQARVDFVARTAEYTPPVVYTLEERAKLVFLVEARPNQPDQLRVGQPVRVSLAVGEARP